MAQRTCANFVIELAAWMFYLGGASKTVKEGKQLVRADRRLRQSLRQIPPDGGVTGGRYQRDRRSHTLAARRSSDRRPQSGRQDTLRRLHANKSAPLPSFSAEAANARKIRSIPQSALRYIRKSATKSLSGESLCTIHCHSDAQGARAKALLQESYQIAAAPPVDKMPLVHRVIYKGGR